MRVFLALLLFLPAACSSDKPADAPIILNGDIDSIAVWKGERKLMVYKDRVLLKTYRVALGRAPVGDKQMEGDFRTPEGLYKIDAKNPHSGYHKNLGISYPNNADRAAARALGKSPGGDIKIHGLPNGRPDIGKLHRLKDWTFGCIALTNEEVDELYQHTRVGTPILISK
ncbi:MAG: hypothetical protein EOP49_28975 [Sphingobacteriales bacterium]|nr:MAG: hypothetical protein EOP49_28975 [Sphingobacteriales bacterium]